MKTIFLSIYDGDTEKVILRSDVLKYLQEAGHRIVLLIRGAGRLAYYKQTFERGDIVVELLPHAATPLEHFLYYFGWNFLPTHSAEVRRMIEYRRHHSVVRLWLGRIAGFFGRFRLVRELVRTLYALSPDNYAAELFEKYKPDLLFAPNMFSPEDFRLVRAAKRRGVPTVATAKSWDVLTTKAFTRVKSDRLLVFNDINKQEAIELGDYAPEKVVVTGFPQFDLYTRIEHESRAVFCTRMGLDPSKRIILYAIPGDWKTPTTKDILNELDRRIDAGAFVKPLQILARLHPKYPDSSEHETYQHIVMDRPGTHISSKKEFSVDMGIKGTYAFTFTDTDLAHLANSLYHSDIIINTESTMTLDASANDKPVILVAYDGDQKLPPLESVARIYERNHYQHVIETNAAPLVKSHDELVAAINHLLQNPGYLRAEREVLKRTMLFKTDGASGKRTAEAVLALLPDNT